MQYPERYLYGDVLLCTHLDLMAASDASDQADSNASVSVVWVEGVSGVASSREFLVGRCLDEQERSTYRQLSRKAQQSWLAGRIAAKDAVRALLWAQSSDPIFPIEISTMSVEQRATYVRESKGGDRSLSISHKGGCAVAAAGESIHVGVDMEPILERTTDWSRVAFSDQERILIGDDPIYLTAAWCAKEAYVKMVKTDLKNPRTWKISDFDRAQSCAKVEGVEVKWRIHKQHIISICITPDLAT